MPDATASVVFACPDLTTFCRLDELGLEVTGQHLTRDRAVLACRVVEPEGSKAGTSQENFILDLGEQPMDGQLFEELAGFNQGRRHPIRRLWVLSGDGLVEVPLHE